MYYYDFTVHSFDVIVVNIPHISYNPYLDHSQHHETPNTPVYVKNSTKLKDQTKHNFNLDSKLFT